MIIVNQVKGKKLQDNSLMTINSKIENEMTIAGGTTWAIQLTNQLINMMY